MVPIDKFRITYFYQVALFINFRSCSISYSNWYSSLVSFCAISIELDIRCFHYTGNEFGENLVCKQANNFVDFLKSFRCLLPFWFQSLNIALFIQSELGNTLISGVNSSN